ncbi:MAG: HlyC/CorC family transporter [Candidatus Omnitrophica bacterium]|nr:HlyC/CorC family transporter [Candidatus Omnitrophota bacterium]
MQYTIIFILLLFSAFFSGSETAFFSLSRLALKRFSASDKPKEKSVGKLLLDPHKLILTILIGNTLVNILSSSVLANILYNSFGEKGIGISIFLALFLLLIFGEITPKMFALSTAEKYTIFAAGPVSVIEKLFTPVRFVLDRVSRIFINLLGIKINEKKSALSEQELRYLFDESHKKGIVKEKEKKMLKNVFTLNDLNAADIMTPRINVFSLDIKSSKEEMLNEIKKNKYSRFPVYIHDIDNVLGVIHAKDIFTQEDKSIKDLLKKPFFVPESMKVDDVLQSLKKNKLHMAIVTDEYGVTSGIVTIEDIVEEIVGEIRDELDYEPAKIKKVDQNTFEVNGQVHINEINEKLKTKIDTTEVDTIGGFVTLTMGKIPKSGDIIELEGYKITVIDVSKNRITYLKFEKEPNNI